MADTFVWETQEVRKGLWAFFSFRELIGWTGKLRPRDQGALTLFFVFVEIYYSTAALYQSSTHITQRNLLRPPGHTLADFYD